MVWLARQAAGGIIEPHDGFEAHQGEDADSRIIVARSSNTCVLSAMVGYPLHGAPTHSSPRVVSASRWNSSENTERLARSLDSVETGETYLAVRRTHLGRFAAPWGGSPHPHWGGSPHPSWGGSPHPLLTATPYFYIPL